MQRTQLLCVPRGHCPSPSPLPLRGRPGGAVSRAGHPGPRGGPPHRLTDIHGFSSPTGCPKIVSRSRSPARDVAGSWPGWAGLALPREPPPSLVPGSFWWLALASRTWAVSCPKTGDLRETQHAPPWAWGFPGCGVLSTVPEGWVPGASGDSAGWPSCAIPGLCRSGRAARVRAPAPPLPGCVTLGGRLRLSGLLSCQTEPVWRHRKCS